MIRKVRLFTFGLCVSVLVGGLAAGGPTVGAHRQQPKENREREIPLSGDSKTPPPLRKDGSLATDDIIRRFAAQESQFREARANYTYRQEVRIQTLSIDDRPTGEFYRVSDIVFSDSGVRSERIVRFPPSTLQGLIITPNDLRDFADVQPFSLTTEELPKYNVTYVGKERIDEIDTHVFDVRPKTIPKYERTGGVRLFLGRIWVDDQDLQIVKTYGKAVPEGQERFPRFSTYRENIDGKYWFPTYTYANDSLDFPGGTIRMLMEIRYTNYKQFKTDVRILDDDEDTPKKK